MRLAKFGGTSLSDAEAMAQVLEVVGSDSEYGCVVNSAPGKRSPDDQKMTDLFYAWQNLRGLGLSCNEVRDLITSRFLQIVADLGLSLDLGPELREVERQIQNGASADYAASRGEYLNGIILAHALGFEFVDPATCIHFDQQGRYLPNYAKLKATLGGRRTVLAGFYGSMPDGSIRTFSRGGSDFTGAIAAAALGVDAYDNFTDVDGLFMADPRIVNNPRLIEVASFEEVRELAYMGASVFHEEAMFPVREAGITTHIRNTRNPTHPGTRIVAESFVRSDRGVVVGVAGKKGFTVITIQKAMMNREVGYARRILSILEDHEISFEHMPGGIDTLSLVIETQQLSGKLETVLTGIRNECPVDEIKVDEDTALVATVGRAMAQTPGVAARLLAAVASQGISNKLIVQGSSEMSILIGVANRYLEKAIRAIYGEFA